jgi:hypothetical protein
MALMTVYMSVSVNQVRNQASANATSKAAWPDRSHTKLVPYDVI